jgi:DNA-directed RNA polymerase specialized sigma24 family protein
METTRRGNVKVTNAELRRWVVETQVTMRPCLEFCTAIQRIALGVREQFHRTSSPEDFASDCLVKVLLAVPKMDPSRNLFGYITNVCINLARSQHHASERERAKLQAFHASRHSEGKE